MKMIHSLSRRILVVASVATLATAGSSFANQPRMQAALADLRSAKAELQAAAHDKGGWRVDALNHLNEVIAEVEKGIAAGR